MRLSHTTSALLALTTSLLSRNVAARLIPDLLHNLDIFNDIEKRCANPCGYYGQLCCGSDQYCYTDSNGQAACGTSATVTGSGSWQYVTTTYVQTDLKTVTATYSTYVGATQAPTTMQCSYSLGQSQCGSTCCDSGYYCQASNVCAPVPAGSSGYYSGVYTVTTIVTNTAGVPVRPTTETIRTLTSSVTGTTAFQSAVGTGGALIGSPTSSSGLSGGAIAGIVIGVILGIILLILICACCCFKGLIDGLLAIFGLGKKKTRVTEETIIEERRSRRSGARAWFGQRPARTTEVVEEKKSSGFGRAAGVATFLGTTAVLLGLKRRHDEKEEANSVSYGSYYSYDYTSDSSPSSITRTSRRSRR